MFFCFVAGPSYASATFDELAVSLVVLAIEVLMCRGIVGTVCLPNCDLEAGVLLQPCGMQLLSGDSAVRSKFGLCTGQAA